MMLNGNSQKIDIYWLLALGCFITGVFMIFSQLAYPIIHREYLAMDKAEQLDFVLDEYYEDITEYLDIPKSEMLPRNRIILKDTLSSPEYVGEYDVSSGIIYLNTEILSDIGYAVNTLVHELTHYKQHLCTGTDELIEAYTSEASLGRAHDDISFEKECNINASRYVASRKLWYYNGKGASFVQCCMDYAGIQF